MNKYLNTGLAILLVSLAMSINIVYAEAPKDIGVEIIRVPSEMDLVDFYADKWGVSRSTLHKTVKCESGYNPNAKNLTDKHKFSTGSFGISQFSRETLATYSKQIGIENADPMNPRDSLDTMAYMFSINQAGHWSCYKRLSTPSH